VLQAGARRRLRVGGIEAEGSGFGRIAQPASDVTALARRAMLVVWRP
jgi:hypothetical protein